MRNHIQRFHEESKTLPANLPPRASRWPLVIFGAGLLPLGIFSLGLFGGLFGNTSTDYWLLNELHTWMVFLAFFSWFCVQVMAFVGLAVRRDWGLGMAYLACLY